MRPELHNTARLLILTLNGTPDDAVGRRIAGFCTHHGGAGRLCFPHFRAFTVLAGRSAPANLLGAGFGHVLCSGCWMVGFKSGKSEKSEFKRQVRSINI